MIRQWFSRLAPVHVARSAEEREAVFRFRYQVVEEEGYRAVPHGLDRERRRLFDDEDLLEETRILHTGRSPEVTGTVRLRVWQAGEVPEGVIATYSLERYPELATMRVAEVGRFLIRPSLRGTLLLPSLAGELYSQLLGEDGADLFVTCVHPEQVPAYRRLGFRTYGGRLVDVGDGVAVPMLGVPTDVDYLKKVESPLFSMVRERLEGGKEPKRGKEAARVAANAAQELSIDPNDVWQELQEGFLAHAQSRPAIFEGLGDEWVRYLGDNGFIIDVGDGLTITREGAGEREIYVILEGTFEATIKGQRVAVMGKGDTFGELAFFRQSGTRVATVTSRGPGRLLVLGRSFLDDLMHKEPELSAAVMFNLARLMAERLPHC